MGEREGEKKKGSNNRKRRRRKRKRTGVRGEEEKASVCRCCRVN